MAERLRPGTLDQLADSIWLLGRVGLVRDIMLMPPAEVHGVITVDDLCLEADFTIEHPLPAALLQRPNSMSLLISEFEPLQSDDAYTLYSYRKLTLDMRRRRHAYDEGIVVEHPDGSSVTPAIAAYIPGRASHRTATTAWSDVVQHERPRFTMAEAANFLETIDRVLMSGATME